MADTKIEWADKVWNPIAGCTKCSPGCLNCYAERMAWRLRCMGKYPYFDAQRSKQVIRRTGWSGEVRCCEERLAQPLHWRKPCRIFVCSMSDLFHEKVPFDFIDWVWGHMSITQQHTYLVLTKRPSRMLDYMTRENGGLMIPREALLGKMKRLKCKSWKKEIALEYPLPNVHLGVSISTQAEADEKIPILLKIPAAFLWLSIEPMLGAIDVKKYLWVRQKCVGEKGCGFTGASYEFDNPNRKSASRCPKCGKNHTYLVTDSIDGVIVGGESGPKARPMHPDWVRSIRDQCVAAGVKFYFKQWGEYAPCDMFQGLQKPGSVISLDGQPAGMMTRVGKKKAGRLLDGREWNQLAERVR